MSTEAHLAFIVQLVQGIKLARLHELDNAAVRDSLEALDGCFAAVGREAPVFELSAQSSVLSFNGQPLRIPRAFYHLSRDLLRLYAEAGISKLSFEGPLSGETTRCFLRVFVGVRGVGPAECFANFSELLSGSPLASRVRIEPAKEEERLQFIEVEVDQEELVRLSYAKLVVLLQDYVRSDERPEMRNYFNFRLRRTVQTLVEALADSRDLIRTMAILDSPSGSEPRDDQSYRAAAQLALLAILTGDAFSLRQSDIVDLALGAAFEPIGDFLAARSAGAEPSISSVEGREHIQALNLYLGQRQLHGTLLTKIVTGYESRVGPPGDVEPHLFARIVGLLAGFVRAMHEGHRVLPDEALGRVFLEARERGEMDLLIARALSNGLALLPLGSVVLLRDERYAVLIDNNPRCLSRPRVTVFQGLRGETLQYRMVDLSELDDERKYRYHIAEIYGPGEAPVSVPALLARR